MDPITMALSYQLILENFQRSLDAEREVSVLQNKIKGLEARIKELESENTDAG